MPSAYARASPNFSRSNVFRVIPPVLAEGQSVGGTATITFISDTKPPTSTTTLETFTFQHPSGDSKMIAPTPKTVTTIVPANSASVILEGASIENGSITSYRCNQHVDLQPNVPVTATCATGKNGAGPVIIVEITNIG
ncbi:MAG: hypothetical protein ABSF09_12740 [Candidatus Bathyarchaeia archaeon]